jgi:stress-induced morphogen
MAVNVAQGVSDAALDQIAAVLTAYQVEHDRARVDVYRQNSVSVRIRIIDPDFHGLDKSQRHAAIWQLLEQLPEEVQADISMLVLLAPNEAATSLANLEFEDPVPSKL